MLNRGLTRLRRRKRALALLGGKCERCGETDWRVLHIDHRSGGGKRQRISRSAHEIVSDVLGMGELAREYFAVLCASCNTLKRYDCREGVKYDGLDDAMREGARAATWYKKKRLQVIELLGGKCARCGETDWRVLHIDHIYGNGADEARAIGYTAIMTKVARLGEAAKREYQLLCANCNWRKRVERQESGGKHLWSPPKLVLPLPLWYNNSEHEPGDKSGKCGMSEVHRAVDSGRL